MCVGQETGVTLKKAQGRRVGRAGEDRRERRRARVDRAPEAPWGSGEEDGGAVRRRSSGRWCSEPDSKDNDPRDALLGREGPTRLGRERTVHPVGAGGEEFRVVWCTPEERRVGPVDPVEGGTGSTRGKAGYRAARKGSQGYGMLQDKGAVGLEGVPERLQDPGR